MWGFVVTRAAVIYFFTSLTFIKIYLFFHFNEAKNRTPSSLFFSTLLPLKVHSQWAAFKRVNYHKQGGLFEGIGVLIDDNKLHSARAVTFPHSPVSLGPSRTCKKAHKTAISPSFFRFLFISVISTEMNHAASETGTPALFSIRSEGKLPCRALCKQAMTKGGINHRILRLHWRKKLFYCTLTAHGWRNQRARSENGQTATAHELIEKNCLFSC